MIFQGDSVKSAIKDLHLEDFQNSSHPSYFFQSQQYNLFIIRLPIIINNKLDALNEGFIIEDGVIYHFEDGKLQYFSDDFLLLHKFLDRLIDQSLRLLENYSDEVLAIEESLYERKFKNNFIDYWFALKKDLIRLDRIYFRAHSALSELIKVYETNHNFTHYRFVDLQEHLDRSQRNVNLNLSKLDTIYSYYQSLKNDKLNHTLYLLTLISVVFLPLNLVVGFFGINTTDLFFTESEGGTMKVVYLLVIVLFAVSVFIPLLLRIYRNIFGKFLNRYEFYRRLMKTEDDTS